jgi:hypothetical protein
MAAAKKPKPTKREEYIDGLNATVAEFRKHRGVLVKHAACGSIVSMAYREEVIANLVRMGSLITALRDGSELRPEAALAAFLGVKS